MMERLPPVSLAVDAATIRRFAELTGDFNPIHLDPGFAASTAMGGVIAHGTMSMNLLWQALGGPAELDVRFLKPVRPGDVVTAGGERSADGSYVVWVRNQDGVDVIRGTATLG